MATIPTPSSITSAINNTTSIASNISSGLGGIPGGMDAVATTVNNALASIPSLPGTSDITNAIKNGLSLPSGKGLLDLATSGLPAAAAAQLTSAIGSLSSAGEIPVKLVTVATETYDRGELTSTFAPLLGNPKIPIPVFGNPLTLGKSR